MPRRNQPPPPPRQPKTIIFFMKNGQMKQYNMPREDDPMESDNGEFIWFETTENKVVNIRADEIETYEYDKDGPEEDDN